jgi:hypothetical protein
LPSDKRRELKNRLMREAQAVSDWPALLGVEVDPITMLDVSARVMAEVYSAAMQPGMADIWTRLRGLGLGLKLAICSNLASP